MMINRHKHLYSVTILRVDGTPWPIEHVKHVILKAHDYALYVGEHGKGRKLILIPRDRVDHIEVEEETQA